MSILRDNLSKYVEKFNEEGNKKEKLDVLLFDYMLQHLARVSRILS